MDQYAAAATLYNLLTGQYVHDFPRAFQERLLMILQDKTVPIQSHGPTSLRKLANVIHRRGQGGGNRFADVRTLRQALLPGGVVLADWPWEAFAPGGGPSLPLSASQTFTVVSQLPLTMRLPSGLNATEVTRRCVPLEGQGIVPLSASQTFTSPGA